MSVVTATEVQFNLSRNYF